MPSSRLVPGRYPPPGVSPIADKIRERRGARGLTPLDGTLLHVPPVAEGWNLLLGAIRTKGNLPGDVRELMILRVAARNHAMFEWIHHEHVGRSHGLTTPQLYHVRDTSSLPSGSGVLNALQTSALAFADNSTKDVKVRPEVIAALQKELSLLSDGSVEKAQDLLVEAAAVVATYNMVSRFLVSLDVAGMSDEQVPWPADRVEYEIPLKDYPDHHLHVVTHTSVDPSAPWLVFSNSLLTNTSMWDPLLAYLLAPPKPYNVILHDQRGHGQSSTPPGPCTVPLLAQDIAHILEHLKISSVHSVIGVSQGGATALSFGTQFPHLTRSVVACDTGPRTAPGNKEAWESRIQLAREKGMSELSQVTKRRWFPHPIPRDELVSEMITATSIEGFALGAGALMDYDLIEDGLLESKVKTLLIAGSLDGDGKVASGMGTLKDRWVQGDVAFEIIQGAGHLPMLDETETFWRVLAPFLETVKTYNK